jgi:hypothetical protein
MGAREAAGCNFFTEAYDGGIFPTISRLLVIVFYETGMVHFQLLYASDFAAVLTW